MSPTHTPPPSIPDDVDEDLGDEIAFLEGEAYEVVNESDQEVVGIDFEDDASDMEDMAPQQDDSKFILKKHNGKYKFNIKRSSCFRERILRGH
ncbi:unnamed protein product [Schistocephalus solidus]|uniref:Transposon MuDR mudrA n=1 Tax=Schistocephalus solidus TaxID=70667 RepID=A0A183SA02_SCHSO|nr:unnamed protein product [Schistocephalus solidus]